MIKFVVRWTFRLVILGIVLLVALILLKDQILKSVLESQMRRSTGMEVKIGSVSTSLMRPELTLEHFVLYNTAEFGGGPFVDIPELHLEYAADAHGRGDLHFKLVRLNLHELNIVENLNGHTNIVDMSAAMDRIHNGGTNESTVRFNGVDTLNLTVGKIRYINLRKPNRNQEINVNLQNEIVQNVRTWNDMAGLLFKLLLRAGITIYLDTPKQTSPPPTQISPTNIPARQPATPPARR
jgi:hypothetical protein